MGLQEIMSGRLQQCQYQKLVCSDEKGTEVRQRGRWLKRANGRLKGIRISRSRKLTLRVFSVYLFSNRVSRIYSGIMTRLNVDGVCPAIVFSTQWGLPVLSHSSVNP